jgi:predicted transcriptional regulator
MAEGSLPTILISAISVAEGMSKARVSQIAQLLRLSPASVHALMQSPRSAQLQ